MVPKKEAAKVYPIAQECYQQLLCMLWCLFNLNPHPHTHFLNFLLKSIILINVCATYSSWDKLMFKKPPYSNSHDCFQFDLVLK